MKKNELAGWGLREGCCICFVDCFEGSPWNIRRWNRCRWWWSGSRRSSAGCPSWADASCRRKRDPAAGGRRVPWPRWRRTWRTAVKKHKRANKTQKKEKRRRTRTNTLFALTYGSGSRKAHRHYPISVQMSHRAGRTGAIGEQRARLERLQSATDRRRQSRSIGINHQNRLEIDSRNRGTSARELSVLFFPQFNAGLTES